MDGFSWLILSWVVVGALCYLALNKLGAPQDNTLLASALSRSQTSDWSNEFLLWLFNNLRRVPGPLDAWMSSLNEAAKKVSSPSNCEILFEGFGDNSAVNSAPRVSNLRAEPGPKDHLTIKGTLDVPEVTLKLVSSQRVDDRLLVSNFNALIRDLHGEVEARLACIANQVYVMACFSGRPELDITLTNTDSSSAGHVDSAVVEAAMRRCLVSAVSNLTLSDLLSKPATRTTSSTQPPVHEMLKRLHEPDMNADNTPPNRLRVLVIRAQRLGKVRCEGNILPDVEQPFVVVELDEPAQKHTTSRGLNTSPYWEESFDFALTPASEEILFEIYEGDCPDEPEQRRFLGLAIVGFDELRRSTESVHTFTLQGRPYRNDAVSGSLTVQFEMWHDSSVSVLGKRTDELLVHAEDGSELRETRVTNRRPIYDPHDCMEGRDVVTTNTTTVTVKAVAQLGTTDSSDTTHSDYDRQRSPLVPLTSTVESKSHPLPASHSSTKTAQFIQASHPKAPELVDLSQQYTTNTWTPVGNTDKEASAKLLTPTDDPTRIARDRSKKTHNEQSADKRERSFFGELRDRLSGRRAKRRAKSMDLTSAQLEEAVSLPPSRDQSQTRPASDKHMSRSHHETSSIGERSGLSAKSLYQHSTLILETNKDGNKRYYLIPPSIVDEPAAGRLMRHGKKLHIYNEHTFVAVKLRGGTVCNVCHHRIARSFSKQAYQCRDCRLVCHKTCHYKTDSFCTASTVSKLDVSSDVNWPHFLQHYQLEEFISSEGV